MQNTVAYTAQCFLAWKVAKTSSNQHSEHPVQLDEIFDTLQTVCLGCDYYVTIECAQTICASLLQNAQYATEVRKFSAHTRTRCVMKITKYPDAIFPSFLTRKLP